MTIPQEECLLTLMTKVEKRARRLCRTTEEAEDMAQEAALRLWQVLQGPQTIDAPENYAMIMVQNLARQGWRRQRATEELSEEMAQDAPLAPARLACAEICAAISRLPPEQAELLKRVMAGETSPQALAVELGLPKGTVMSRLARARARLRREMGLGQDGSVAELL